MERQPGNDDGDIEDADEPHESKKRNKVKYILSKHHKSRFEQKQTGKGQGGKKGRKVGTRLPSIQGKTFLVRNLYSLVNRWQSGWMIYHPTGINRRNGGYKIQKIFQMQKVKSRNKLTRQKQSGERGQLCPLSSRPSLEEGHPSLPVGPRKPMSEEEQPRGPSGTERVDALRPAEDR